MFLESEIKAENPTINLITLIADITDNVDIEKILANHKPDILLHSAAHKHVPFMETNPVKAVKNNIIVLLLVSSCICTEFTSISRGRWLSPGGGTRRGRC